MGHAASSEEEMRKLLLLGTSLSSVEIVQTAKEMGCYTVVTDNLSPEVSSAKKEADEYWMISTGDIEQLEAKCKEHHIDAVFAGVSEFNLDRVKELTGRLGLPCYIEDSAWKYARDKSAFKKKCREIGVPVVEDYAVSDPPTAEELKRIVYPVVVKPVDGTGNKGLSICYNDEELVAGCRKAKSAGASGKIVIERYITGEESWNDYFLAEGEVRYAYSGRAFREPGYPTFLYLLGISTRSDHWDYMEQVNDRCIALIKDIGCKKGIVWFQFIRDKDGRYYALEMAQRISADMSGKTIEKAGGVNALKWVLDTAFGDDHTADMLPRTIEPPYDVVHCAYFQFARKGGIVSHIQGYEELDEDKYQVSFVAHKGDKVDKYRLMARIVFNSRSSGAICDAVREINSKTRILDEHGENMYIPFTDFDRILETHKGLFKEG